MAIPVNSTIQTQIANLYIAILGRNPEPAGFGYWCDMLANGNGSNATLNAITLGFSNSPEFIATYSGQTTSAAVTLMYQNVLNRAPDANGLAYWTAQVQNYTNQGYTNSQALALTGNQLITAAAANTGTADQTLILAKEQAAIASGTTAPTTTYTLTTGIDNVTGKNLAIVGSGTTFQAYDTINVTGTSNSLTITDTTAASATGVPSGVTVAGVQTATINSTGTVGRAAVAAGQVTRAQQTLTFGSTPLANATVTISVGGISTTSTNGATTTGAALATAVAANLVASYQALGYTVVAGAASNTAGTVYVDNTTAGTVVVTGLTTGASLAAATVTASSAAAALPTANTVVAGVTATAAVSAAVYDVSGWTGLTQITTTSVGGANIKAAATTNVTETNTGAGLVTVAGGLAVNATNNDSVDVLGAAGAVNVTIKSAKPTTAGSNTAAGVLVTGGTTVTVTEAAATVSGTTGTSLSNNTQIVIGAAPSATAGATATGYPQVIAGLSSDPTGNVTTNVSTSWTNAAGLKDVVFGTGTVAAYTNGATTVSVTGSGGATITDVQTTLLQSSATATAVAGTSTLTTVNLAGMSGASTVKSDVIANLSITDSSNGSVTISGSSSTASNTGTLNLSIGNSTATVATPNNTTINVNAVNSNYGAIAGTAVGATSPSSLTLTAAKATSLSFAGTSAVTLASSTLTALASITDSSAGTVNLGDVSGYTKLASINAGAATGALTATIGSTGTTVGMAVTGGAGNDVITLKSSANLAPGTTTAGGTVITTINLGSGNDAVYSTGTAATVAVGTIIDAGAGAGDIVSANLVTNGNASVFRNFEVVDTTLMANSAVLDTTLLGAGLITGINYHGSDGTSIAATTDTVNIQNLANNSTLNITGFTNQAALNTGYLQNITQTHIAGASTTAITFAATPSAAAGAGTGNYSYLGTFTSNGDTSISINSGGGTNLTGNGITKIAETTNTLTTITITGAKAFTLAAVETNTLGTQSVTTASALTLIDGSTATGALTITAGGNSTFNTNVTQTYTGLTINGGSAADTITTNASQGVVNAGGGADTIIVGASIATFLTGGAGEDTFTVTSATAGAAATSAPIFTTILDAATGDKIGVIDNATTDTFNATAVSTAAATSLQSALNLIVASNSNVANTSTINNWGVYGGNTYIVSHTGTGATVNALATADVVVKLTGIYDLSTATISTAGVITLG